MINFPRLINLVFLAQIKINREKFSLHKKRKKKSCAGYRSFHDTIIHDRHRLEKNRGVGQNEAAGVIKKKERGVEGGGGGGGGGGLLPRGEFRKGIPPPFL